MVLACVLVLVYVMVLPSVVFASLMVLAYVSILANVMVSHHEPAAKLQKA